MLPPERGTSSQSVLPTLLGITILFSVLLLFLPASAAEYPPGVWIESPTEGETVHGFVTIQGRAEHRDGEILGVRISIDEGESIEARDTSDGNWTSWDWDWNTYEFDDGPHRINVTVFDGTFENVTWITV